MMTLEHTVGLETVQLLLTRDGRLALVYGFEVRHDVRFVSSIAAARELLLFPGPVATGPLPIYNADKSSTPIFLALAVMHGPFSRLLTWERIWAKLAVSIP
jgi:hypothetical protein